MSYRYNNAFVKPGLNTLVAPTPSYEYGLLSWGRNQFGQLGLGNTTNYSSPKQVGALVNWLNVSSGSYHSIAVKTDGTLWSWGRNNNGQLGLGNTTNYSSPKQVGSLTNWLKAVGTYGTTIAIKTDGTIWSWGYGANGVLGTGSTASTSSPNQVGALTNWYDMAAGGQYVLATKTDGTLWAWGSNNAGQLGQNNTTNYSSPKQIGVLTNWLKIACSAYSSFAIKTDGTLWAWGSGSTYATGLSVVSNYSSPKQVGALTTWLYVAGSNSSGFAVKTTNSLWSWGYNNVGQLGLGDTTNRSSPVQIGALTNWNKIFAFGFTTFSIKTDGTLWSWGQNNLGQLGLGNTTYYSSPKQVGSLATWYQIGNSSFSGARSTIALQVAATLTPYTRYGGIWKLNAASAAKGAGTWPIPNSAYLVLLCHFDNGNGSTTFTDSSSKANTLTPANGAAQSSTQYKFAPSSFYSGSAATPSAPYISLPNTYMNFGTNNFTFSTWYYSNGTYPSYGVFFDNGGQGFAAQFGSAGNDLILVSQGTTILTSSAHGMSSGNWYYLTWVRSGNTATIYVNGNSVGSVDVSGKSFSPASGSSAYINTYSGTPGNYSVGSYLDEMAIFNGVALYTSNFTPPTQPF